MSVCLSVCLFVCVFTFEVLFKRLFAPTSPSRMFLSFCVFGDFFCFQKIWFWGIPGPPGNHASRWIRDPWSKGISLILAYFYTFLSFYVLDDFFRFFKFCFWGILGPPYCGICATIRIGREMLCLPYAGFFKQN